MSDAKPDALTPGSVSGGVSAESGAADVKYRLAQSSAIDSGSALPKELVQLIASYVPPDFALRWTWLASALARLPVVTYRQNIYIRSKSSYFTLSYHTRSGAAQAEFVAAAAAYAAFVGPNAGSLLLNAPARAFGADDVMQVLASHTLERQAVAASHHNQSYFQLSGICTGGGIASGPESTAASAAAVVAAREFVTAQLQLIRAELDALSRDWNARFEETAGFASLLGGGRSAVAITDPTADADATVAAICIRVDDGVSG